MTHWVLMALSNGTKVRIMPDDFEILSVKMKGSVSKHDIYKKKFRWLINWLERIYTLTLLKGKM